MTKVATKMVASRTSERVRADISAKRRVVAGVILMDCFKLYIDIYVQVSPLSSSSMEEYCCNT